MGIIATLRTKAVTVLRRALNIMDPQSWPLERESSTGETVNPESVLALSTAWSCINLHAGVIGSLPLLVYQRQADGSAKPAREHWLFRLVHDSPNADQTALDFWEFMQACLELRGNAYAYVPRGPKGRILSLEPIASDFVQVVRVDGRLKYRYPNGRGEPVERDQADMFHLRGFGGGPMGGLSTLAFGRESFGLAIALDKSAGSTFKNGMRPSGILKFSEWLKAPQRQETRETLDREHAGAARSGRPLILEGGVTWESMGFSPEDSQLLQSRSFSVEDICRWFGVPPVLVGHTEKVSAWGTGIGEITRGFVMFALRRRCKRIEQAISKQLLSAEDRAAGIFAEFSLEGLLRGSPKERAEFYASMTRSGILAINECRAYENLPPVPGGETPRLQMQNVTLLPSNDSASLDNVPPVPEV